MSGDFWNGRTVMVTGGAGFLGSHLVDELESRSDNVEIFVPRSDEYDLREKSDIKDAFEDSGADTVIHLAATVGGIGANRENPGRYFYDNAVMGIELIEQSRQYIRVQSSGRSVRIQITHRFRSRNKTSSTGIQRRQTLHMELQKRHC